MSSVGRSTIATRGGRGARERILNATVELFARDGIQATGIAKLTDAANVSTRTLYQHFASKEELVNAYLEALESDPLGASEIEGVLDRDDLTPRERLLGLFAVPAGDSLAGSVVRGCPFHNTAVEAAGTMPQAAALVERHKKQLATKLNATAVEAGARNPEELGKRLALIFEGARALSTSLNDRRPFRDAQNLAEALIDQATTPAR